MRFGLALALIVTASGCWSTLTGPGSITPNRYQLLASGFIGCRATDIAITEYLADSSGSSSWVATCRSRTFVCGGSPQGTAHCTELAP